MKFVAAFVALLAVAAASPLKPATNELAQLEAIVAAINSPSTDPATAALLEQQLAALLPIAVGAPIVAVPEVVLPEPGVLPILPEEPIIISPMPVVQPGPIAPISPPSSISPINPIVPPFPISPIGPIVLPMPVVEPTPVLAPVAEPVVPSPVVVGEIPNSGSALIQIIVNVNEVNTGSSPAATPVVGAQEVIVPGPVNVVEQADNIVSPVQVVSPVVVSPVQVAEPIVPGPVNIVDHPVSVESPVVVEPVAVGTPILPVVVEPVAVGTPILPAPVMTLPEELN